MKKFALSRLNLFVLIKDFFASLWSSFFEFGKILPHSREFDHHFVPQGRELNKKIARVAGIRSLKKIPRGLSGGGGVSSWS